MRSWCSLLISFAALAAGAVQAAPPAELELAFEVRRDGSPIADVVHRLQHDGARYRLTEVWSGRGLYTLMGKIRRASHGAVAADGLRPAEYVDERSGRVTERARFDWASSTVTLQHRGTERTVPLPQDSSDRLAFVYEFAFDPAASCGARIHVVDARHISGHHYVPAGREQLKTPAGEFNALKLVRSKPNGERAELWLAAEHSLIPVRILVVDEDGTQLDQVVTRVSGF
jgi:hypothetical protein